MASQPPGPRSWNPLGSLPEFRSDPLAFVERVARVHGPVAHFRLGRRDAYLVTEPDLVREILIGRNREFVKSRLLQRSRELLGDGLLTAEGSHHLRQRRMIQPSFHRDRIAEYGREMVSQAAALAQEWEGVGEVDVAAEMNRLTLTIAGSTLLGSQVERGEATSIGASLTDALGLFERMTNPLGPILDRLPIQSTRRLEHARDSLDATIHRLIDQKRDTAEQGTDLLSTLLVAADVEGDGGTMSTRQIRDEILTIFLAGHETTANALSWTWLLLSLNPEAEQRLHEELDSVLDGRFPSPEDYDRIPYTRNVLAESMRLYPPAWSVGRQPLKDVEVGGYELREGSIVLLSQWVTHRDARWFEEPRKFDPSRWDGGLEDRLPRYAYFPFSAGTRKCIGDGFAWMEGVLVLASIAQHWKIRYNDPSAIRPRALITLRQTGDTRASLIRR